MLPARNILIFHLGALGDFVVTWPLAVALGRLYPQSRVIYVTHGQKGKLAERVLGVESRDIDSGRWHDLFADGLALPDASSKLLGGAQKIFSFLGQAGDSWVDNVRRLAPRADVYAPEPRPRGPWPGHVSEFILDQLRPDPAVFTSMQQILQSVHARGLARGMRGGGGVVIHPGSGSREKCWPAGRFVELAERLTSAGRRVRFCVGETELDRVDRATLASFEAVAPVERPADLVQLASLLQSADVFVGNDSGPSHLAGILGNATVALFGPASDSTVWTPLGPNVVVKNVDMLVTDDVQPVYEQVTASWPAPTSNGATQDD